MPPNFSINADIVKIIEGCGYFYDSNYNSFALHGCYGQISLNGDSKQRIAHKISENFFELSISNIQLNSRVLPLGGGSYFRLPPFSISKVRVNSILQKDNAYLFYTHPWEIDSNQTKVN